MYRLTFQSTAVCDIARWLARLADVVLVGGAGRAPTRGVHGVTLEWTRGELSGLRGL